MRRVGSTSPGGVADTPEEGHHDGRAVSSSRCVREAGSPSLPIRAGARCRPAVSSETRDVRPVAASARGTCGVTGRAEVAGPSGSSLPPLVPHCVIWSVRPLRELWAERERLRTGEIMLLGQSYVVEVGPCRSLHSPLGDANHHAAGAAVLLAPADHGPEDPVRAATDLDVLRLPHELECSPEGGL